VLCAFKPEVSKQRAVTSSPRDGEINICRTVSTTWYLKEKLKAESALPFDPLAASPYTGP